MRNVLVPFIFKCLAHMPLVGARAVGIFIGHCLWLTKCRAYRITTKNLHQCFPELSAEEVSSLARKSLIETAQTAAEAGTIWRHSWAWLQTKIVAVEGEDILRGELEKGKGLIVIAPHIGNWEVVAPYLAHIKKLTAMYQPVSIPAMDKLILEGRSKNNIQMAPTSRKGIAMLLKSLQQGEIVGVLPDQLPKKDAGGEFAPFFGKDALTMTLIHSLINRTECRVVSVFAQRVAGGFKMITLPPDHDIYNADVQESVKGLNKSIERCVRISPTQYQWEYNRFRFTKEHEESRSQKRDRCI